MPRPRKTTLTTTPSFLQNIQQELNLNQSYLSLVLGLLIVLIVGVLVFNYFKGRSSPNLIPAQQTSSETKQENVDVSPDKLPGTYTVKEGDTLFAIALQYYQDGLKFDKIVAANKLSDENILVVGQKLQIPKLEEGGVAVEKNQPSPEPSPSVTPQSQTADNLTSNLTSQGVGGAENQTIWGERITADTYTVVEGDWLSKIAGRAYGDIFAFKKLAQVNNISNPDLIFPGQVIKIPR